MNGATRGFTLTATVMRSMQSKSWTCRALLDLLTNPPTASGRDWAISKDTLPIQPVVSLRSIWRVSP